ncbi:MAG TPA: hypothetical protein VJ829_15810, partial [Candidatus Binatia bacterium]|nr:hypothetical protein [Candidatus Binatia bacterium]
MPAKPVLDPQVAIAESSPDGRAAGRIQRRPVVVAEQEQHSRDASGREAAHGGKLPDGSRHRERVDRL